MNKSGYKSCFYSKTGFTLIELLVVVLIIGILAAVAVPQYQKAVEKSRAMEAMLLVKSLGQAQEVYVLEHGTYANSLNELSVTPPTGWKTLANNKCEGGGITFCVGNEHWAIGWVGNSGYGWKYVTGTPLEGAYVGTALFMYIFETDNSAAHLVPKRKLLCRGKKYCTKLFNASYVGYTSDNNAEGKYNMYAI